MTGKVRGETVTSNRCFLQDNLGTQNVPNEANCVRALSQTGASVCVPKLEVV
jgi:hypothetical protein